MNHTEQDLRGYREIEQMLAAEIQRRAEEHEDGEIDLPTMLWESVDPDPLYDFISDKARYATFQVYLNLKKLPIANPYYEISEEHPILLRFMADLGLYEPENNRLSLLGKFEALQMDCELIPPHRDGGAQQHRDIFSEVADSEPDEFPF